MASCGMIQKNVRDAVDKLEKSISSARKWIAEAESDIAKIRKLQDNHSMNNAQRCEAREAICKDLVMHTTFAGITVMNASTELNNRLGLKVVSVGDIE